MDNYRGFDLVFYCFFVDSVRQVMGVSSDWREHLNWNSHRFCPSSGGPMFQWSKWPFRGPFSDFHQAFFKKTENCDSWDGYCSETINRTEGISINNKIYSSWLNMAVPSHSLCFVWQMLVQPEDSWILSGLVWKSGTFQFQYVPSVLMPFVNGLV